MTKTILYMLTALTWAYSTTPAETYSQNLIDCASGSAEACYDAGAFYSAKGYTLKEYNSTDAAHKVASLYKQACDLGSMEGCSAYAMSYASGKDLDKEHKGAKYYFQKACDGGVESACTMLKMMPEE